MHRKTGSEYMGLCRCTAAWRLARTGKCFMPEKLIPETRRSLPRDMQRTMQAQVRAEAVGYTRAYDVEPTQAAYVQKNHA
jgi:hypothetical protein